jgi:hypothetical protein
MANMIQAVIGSTGFEYFTIVPFVQALEGNPPGCTSGITGFQDGTYGSINGLSSGVKFRGQLILSFQYTQTSEYLDNPPFGECAVGFPTTTLELSGTGLTRNFISRIEMYSGITLLQTIELSELDFFDFGSTAAWTYPDEAFFGDNFRIYY